MFNFKKPKDSQLYKKITQLFPDNPTSKNNNNDNTKHKNKLLNASIEEPNRPQNLPNPDIIKKLNKGKHTANKYITLSHIIS